MSKLQFLIKIPIILIQNSVNNRQPSHTNPKHPLRATGVPGGMNPFEDDFERAPSDNGCAAALASSNGFSVGG
jgi:hypothetical protein